MDPLDRPQVIGSPVGIEVLTVDKDTIPTGYRVLFSLIVDKPTATLNVNKKERGQILPLAGVGLLGCQPANFLQIHKVILGKFRGGVQKPVRGYVFTLK